MTTAVLSRKTGIKAAQIGPARSSVWWLGLSLAAPILGLLFLTRDAVTDLANLWWTNDTYGHGLLIVPISLYLIWSRRAFRADDVRPDFTGIAFILAASVMWLVARLTDVMVGEQLSIVVMVWGVCWVVLGRRITRRLAFPLGYLLLAVPIWAA